MVTKWQVFIDAFDALTGVLSMSPESHQCLPRVLLMNTQSAVKCLNLWGTWGVCYLKLSLQSSPPPNMKDPN